MIDPIERYSKPKPIRFAGALGALGVAIAGTGLYLFAAAAVSNTAQQAVSYASPAPQPQYVRPAAPAPAPTPAQAPAPMATPVAAPVSAPIADSGPSEEERFDAARSKIVAVLQQGPYFSGEAYKEGEGETEVKANIAWDDVSKRASGEISFLTFNTKAEVDGLVAEDQSHRGQFVLRLKARNTDCFYYLTPTANGQLAGTWQWGYGHASGTISVHPTSNQTVASAEVPSQSKPSMAAQPAATPVAVPAAQPVRQPPPAAAPAPTEAAVPAGTLIDIATTEEIDPTQAARTWHGRTTDGFNLNNNETIDAGAVVLMQLVRNGQAVGIHLVGVRYGNRILPVKSEVLPLNVRASNDPVVSQNGNTATVNLGGFFRSLGNRIAANTPYTFTIAR